MDILILRLAAPLMSFGGVTVDKHGVTDPFPGQSLITGLLGNALGYRRQDFDALERLQDRIRYAVRCDRQGVRLIDYQTVDLLASYMEVGWTTWGRVTERGGKKNKKTHERLRHYWQDGVYTVALTLEPAADSPTIDEVEQALNFPARTLYIGRKCCIPSRPLWEARLEAESPLRALEIYPRAPRAGETITAWWEAEEGAVNDLPGQRLIQTISRRDWRNRIHCGQKLLWQGLIDPPEAP